MTEYKVYPFCQPDDQGLIPACFAHDYPYLPRVVDHVDIVYCYWGCDLLMTAFVNRT